MLCLILIVFCFFPFFFYSGVYILIGAGSLIMLVGFFGCCGAVRESQCLLGSVSTNTHLPFFNQISINLNHRQLIFPLPPQFFACLLIIFGSEVAAGVFAFLNKDKVHLFEDSFINA